MHQDHWEPLPGKDKANTAVQQGDMHFCQGDTSWAQLSRKDKSAAAVMENPTCCVAREANSISAFQCLDSTG